MAGAGASGRPGDDEYLFVEEVIAKRLPFDKEYRIVRKKDGQIRWVHGLGQGEFDEAGNALSLIGTIQDITDRKLSDEVINKLNYALEATGEVAYMTDNEGIFTYVNPAFSNIYGYQAEEVIGKVIPRILKGGLVDALAYKHFWKELLNKQVVIGEWINKTKDGRNIHIEATTNAIINERGEAIGFIALLSKQDVDREEQQNYIQMIEKSSARLFNIINEIIDISKIESGQMEVFTLETNINEQLDLAYNLLKPDAEAKGIILTCHKGLKGKDTMLPVRSGCSTRK